MWQADLVDMQSLSLHNDDIKYLLTCIDMFSRYSCVRPLKNKSGLCVKEAFEYILIKKSPSTYRPIKVPSSKILCFKVNWLNTR